jgi:hypothetical protein
MIRRLALIGIVLCALEVRAHAQSTTLTVHHNANLRAAPSTQVAILLDTAIEHMVCCHMIC